ncbi:hypothetical protein Sinac_2433 [Singulisphaera acidiphila DSM 18658]|uniref:Uncharacterized protein n=1 Tax=Singulisphaera acidiphila (strain ATCC BAA-1392 / DSM 18658 / VKM B-2454 / MOB10) TaxID=886293 RepID=L0DBJ1_SINAD|nr:hypothetical protein Sinac_2433 [Singulisphaera acidiphila DSM 18658]
MLLMPYSNLDKKPYVDQLTPNGHGTDSKAKLAEIAASDHPWESTVFSRGTRKRRAEGIDPGSFRLGWDSKGSSADTGR